MKQVTKKERKPSQKTKPKKPRSSKPSSTKKKRWHPKFGTSKLEQDCAEQFLDKLGVEYVWQFEAADIGRFYDFYLPKTKLLIEVDGSWVHSDPRVVSEEKLTPMHKKNMRVDDLKNKWAMMHGIPIMRFWEKDIRENPKMVMEALKRRLHIQEEINEKKDNKNKRHINKLK